MFPAALVCSGVLLCGTLASSPDRASDASLGVEPLRAAYAHAGYDVDAAAIWAWQVPAVTSFHVTDRRGGRVLLVEVFADASLARSEAERKGGGSRVNNVALLQSGDRMLVNEAELECAPELLAVVNTAQPIAVDADFVALVALGSNP
jgi:hypothetical protein